MPRKIGENCGSCYYWQQMRLPDAANMLTSEQAEQLKTSGNCHYDPPAGVLAQVMRPGNVATSGQPYIDSSAGAVWPPVSAHEWCGKFLINPLKAH